MRGRGLRDELGRTSAGPAVDFGRMPGVGIPVADRPYGDSVLVGADMQLTLEGKTKDQVAIERIQAFEPPEGYYLAFSGGKDSVTLLALAKMAGVKFDAHYHLTTVDPPEVVQFIKGTGVEIVRPPKTMWQLAVEPSQLILPTRTRR